MVMNTTKILPWTICIALVVMLGLQELRFHRAVAEMRADLAANTRVAEAASAGLSNNAEELRDALRQLSHARAELAATQQRLASVAAASPYPMPGGLGARMPRRPPVEPLDTSSLAEVDRFTAEAARNVRRAWGEEQATGAPDTMQAGDISTAWAPKLPDGGEEWLHLDYSNQVQLAEVRIRETHNPGAISKVAAVLPNGQEITIWEGVE